MKKLIFAGAFLFLGTLALSSCKKDWVCVCEDNGYENKVIENQTKSKAKKICENKASIGLIKVGGNNCYIK